MTSLCPFVPLNAYVVQTREWRSYTEPVMDDGSGPQIPVHPTAPVVAATPGQAKKLFLDDFAYRPRSGVETDDWNELRVRLLVKDVSLAPGVHEEVDDFWARIHEVEDHGGKPCDCPESVWDEALGDWAVAE